MPVSSLLSLVLRIFSSKSQEIQFLFWFYRLRNKREHFLQTTGSDSRHLGLAFRPFLFRLESWPHLISLFFYPSSSATKDLGNLFALPCVTHSSVPFLMSFGHRSRECEGFMWHVAQTHRHLFCLSRILLRITGLTCFIQRKLYPRFYH